MPPILFPKVVSAKYPTAGVAIPNPSRPLKEGVKSSSIIFEADSGHEQRRVKGDSKRTLDLMWNVLLKDQLFTLRDFYLLVTTVTPFLFTHPIEDIPLLVRFTNDTFTSNQTKHGPKGPLYELQLSVLQVWE